MAGSDFKPESEELKSARLKRIEESANRFRILAGGSSIVVQNSLVKLTDMEREELIKFSQNLSENKKDWE